MATRKMRNVRKSKKMRKTRSKRKTHFRRKSRGGDNMYDGIDAILNPNYRFVTNLTPSTKYAKFV